MARSPKALAKPYSNTPSTTPLPVSRWQARSWTTQCRGPTISPPSTSASTARAAQPTRSASKVAAKPAPLVLFQPSPTPSQTRWRRSASPISPVRRRQSGSGGRQPVHEAGCAGDAKYFRSVKSFTSLDRCRNYLTDRSRLNIFVGPPQSDRRCSAFGQGDTSRFFKQRTCCDVGRAGGGFAGRRRWLARALGGGFGRDFGLRAV